MKKKKLPLYPAHAMEIPSGRWIEIETRAMPDGIFQIEACEPFEVEPVMHTARVRVRHHQFGFLKMNAETPIAYLIPGEPLEPLHDLQ